MIQIETTSLAVFNQAFGDYISAPTVEGDVLLLGATGLLSSSGAIRYLPGGAYACASGQGSIPVVRRMSGGRTVYRDAGTLNYALISRPDGPLGRPLSGAGHPGAGRALSVSGTDRTCDIAADGKKNLGNCEDRRQARPAPGRCCLIQTCRCPR